MTLRGFTLEWNGEKLSEDVLRASEGAIDAVLENTTELASTLTPRDTGRLAESYGYALAQRQGENVVGTWGNGDWKFWIVEARHPSQAGFARRAADTVYPTLTDEIKRRLPK